MGSYYPITDEDYRDSELVSLTNTYLSDYINQRLDKISLSKEKIKHVEKTEESKREIETKLDEVFKSHQVTSQMYFPDNRYMFYLRFKQTNVQLTLDVDCDTCSEKIKLQFFVGFLNCVNTAVYDREYPISSYEKVINILELICSQDFKENCQNKITKVIEEFFINPKLAEIAFSSIYALCEKTFNSQEEYEIIKCAYLAIITFKKSNTVKHIFYKEFLDNPSVLEKLINEFNIEMDKET